jgi:hypothetical protein
MAFRLSKRQAAELADYSRALRIERANIADEFARVMDVIRDEIGNLNECFIAPHNETIQKAAAFVESVAEEFRDVYDERSERWQESEAGQQALAFVEEWENARLEEVDSCRFLTPDGPYFEESLNLPERSE